MHAGNCKHFNGIQNTCCSAGVNYRETFDDSTPGFSLRAPCLHVYSRSEKLVHVDRRGEVMRDCALFQAITEEEDAADKAEWAASLVRLEKGLCTFTGCAEPLTVDGAWMRCPKHGNVVHTYKGSSR